MVDNRLLDASLYEKFPSDGWMHGKKRHFGIRRFARKVAHTPIRTVYHTRSKLFAECFYGAKQNGIPLKWARFGDV